MIKKRNLDPSLIQWIMSQTGLGPGIGELFWVAPASSSTSQFRTQLQRWGVEQNYKIYTSPVTAYADMVNYRNDVMMVLPGAYALTAELDWAKNHTHMLGLGGSNNQITYSSSRDMHRVTLYTTTSAVPHALHVYGYRNIFHGIDVVNAGAAATNLCALKVGGVTTNIAYGNHFKNCTFHGCMSTSQNTTESSSVQIGSGASNYLFEDCIIGQNTFGGDRATTYQGHVYFSGTADSGAAAGVGTQNGMWKDCIFLSRTATAGIVPMVRIGDHATAHGSGVGDESQDRVHWWINCHFDNWGDASMPTVFYDLCLGGHSNKLVDCSAHNYLEWRELYGSQAASDTIISCNMPVSNAADAGIAVVPTS